MFTKKKYNNNNFFTNLTNTLLPKAENIAHACKSQHYHVQKCYQMKHYNHGKLQIHKGNVFPFFKKKGFLRELRHKFLFQKMDFSLFMCITLLISVNKVRFYS